MENDLAGIIARLERLEIRFEKFEQLEIRLEKQEALLQELKSEVKKGKTAREQQ